MALDAKQAQLLSAEPVTFTGRPKKDADGRIVPGTGSTTLLCRVYPAGATEVGDAVFDGNTSALTVLAPGGAAIDVQQTVTIRGLDYEVIHVPFDWSLNRKASHPAHRPLVSITVERRAVD